MASFHTLVFACLAFMCMSVEAITAPVNSLRTTQSSDSAISMRCRTNLKKEKAKRNRDYARQFRKKAPAWKPRGPAGAKKDNSDAEYLAAVFNTLGSEAAQ